MRQLVVNCVPDAVRLQHWRALYSSSPAGGPSARGRAKAQRDLQRQDPEAASTAAAITVSAATRAGARSKRTAAAVEDPTSSKDSKRRRQQQHRVA